MYQLPSLADLTARARQAFRANLKGSDAWIWPNNIYVTAKVISGQMFEWFGYAAYIAKMMFAHTAPDIESLRLHGAEYDVPQKSAGPARGTVRLTATTALTVNMGAVFERIDGVQYVAIDGGGTTGAGTLDVTVEARMDGAASNAEGGTALAIISGVTGDATAVVAPDAAIVLGVDEEDIESYRARILFRKRYVAMGGSAADYVRWAGEVSGVSFIDGQPTVFVERLWNGPGTVRVFPLMFDLYVDGIPTPADVLRVADHIDVVRPAGAVVSVQAASSVPVDITIGGLSPDTPVVRDAVMAELQFRVQAHVAGRRH